MGMRFVGSEHALHAQLTAQSESEHNANSGLFHYVWDSSIALPVQAVSRHQLEPEIK